MQHGMFACAFVLTEKARLCLELGRWGRCGNLGIKPMPLLNGSARAGWVTDEWSDKARRALRRYQVPSALSSSTSTCGLTLWVWGMRWPGAVLGWPRHTSQEWRGPCCRHTRITCQGQASHPPVHCLITAGVFILCDRASTAGEHKAAYNLDRNMRTGYRRHAEALQPLYVNAPGAIWLADCGWAAIPCVALVRRAVAEGHTLAANGRSSATDWPVAPEHWRRVVTAHCTASN